jgi:hypothetical protein
MKLLQRGLARQRIMQKSCPCAPKHTPLFSRAEEATNSHYRCRSVSSAVIKKCCKHVGDAFLPLGSSFSCPKKYLRVDPFNGGGSTLIVSQPLAWKSFSAKDLAVLGRSSHFPTVTRCPPIAARFRFQSLACFKQGWDEEIAFERFRLFPKSLRNQFVVMVIPHTVHSRITNAGTNVIVPLEEPKSSDDCSNSTEDG